MIGILGGTFDPPHWGHVKLAKNFIDMLGLSELIWLPAGQPWQKSSLITPAQTRYDMTLAAADDLKSQYHQPTCPAQISVSRIELDRTGPSYTIDTARQLREMFGTSHSLVWLMGADTYQNLPSWNDWQELPKYLHLAVASRQISPNKDLAILDNSHLQTIEEMIEIFDQRITKNIQGLQSSAHGKIFFDEHFHVDLSSTTLRELLHEGCSKEKLTVALPPKVLEYIFSNNIYSSYNL